MTRRNDDFAFVLFSRLALIARAYGTTKAWVAHEHDRLVCADYVIAIADSFVERALPGLCQILNNAVIKSIYGPQVFECTPPASTLPRLASARTCHTRTHTRTCHTRHQGDRIVSQTSLLNWTISCVRAGLETFPVSQLYLLQSESLLSDGQAEMGRLFKHLAGKGLPDPTTPPGATANGSTGLLHRSSEGQGDGAGTTRTRQATRSTVDASSQLASSRRLACI